MRTWDGPEKRERVRGREVYHDGKWVADGHFVHFDREGRVEREGEMRLGFETGPWQELYPDGGRGSGEYVDGKRHGPWTYYHPEGTRHQEGAYVAGKREGRWVEWYEDGARLRSEVEWREGARHGQALYRNPDGTTDPELSGWYEEDRKVR